MPFILVLRSLLSVWVCWSCWTEGGKGTVVKGKVGVEIVARLIIRGAADWVGSRTDASSGK